MPFARSRPARQIGLIARHTFETPRCLDTLHAIDGAIYHPIGTLYQLQPSFHSLDGTGASARAGKEFY